MTLIISCVTVAACYGGGPHVAGCFLFLLVSNALDVEGTGDGVCKMSEDPSETSFSLQSACVHAHTHTKLGSSASIDKTW